MSEAKPKAATTVQVRVSYAGAEDPFKRRYSAEARLDELKADVLPAFGLAETTDSGGNQTLYFLYLGGDKLADLSVRLTDLADHGRQLRLRLVREVIAGASG